MLLQHGRTLRTCCSVKQVSYKIPDTVWCRFHESCLQSPRPQTQKVGWRLPRAEGRGAGELVFNGHRVPTGGDGKLWRWMGPMAAEQPECTPCH